ncbi:glycoside hydrolase family 19 protein [Agarilytica rhodophyticola]|uniref:glycoside hydrolase family 19 protein n=1 Tax=Agarilytica rhodophyticola TaxID=1737490 RepID=UPI000B346536|nr:glycoside hydrolase family 19 protein [Agarilytica rhodophyticola]
MSIKLTNDDLKNIMPKSSLDNIEFYLPSLNRKTSEFGILSPLQLAHFIAQIAHESGSFNYKVENLNYSTGALRAVFGKYFEDESTAEEYARKPEKIANVVYANRMGNGDTASGDGWRYRGRGLIQLTGRDNYASCSKAIGVDVEKNPDLLAGDADVIVAAACWFWQSRGLNQLAEQDDIKQITKKINGGYNGLDDRKEYLVRAKKTFHIK